MVKKYRDWSVKLKLLTITALLILGSVFVESYLSYTQYTKDFERQSTDKVNQIIEQVSLNIDTYLDDLFRLTLAPYRNAGVMAALEQDGPDSELEELNKRRLVETYLEEMMIYPRKDILRVSIITDETYSSGRIPSGGSQETNPQNSDWYREAMNTQDYVFVPSHMQQIGGDQSVSVISVVRRLVSTRTQQVLGVIKVDANYNGIVDISSRANMGEDGGLLILDDKNNVVYSASDKDKAIAGSANRAGYIVSSIPVSRVGWQVVAVNSVKEMNRQAMHTRNTAFLFAVASSLLAIVVLFLFVRQFMRPLLAIVRLMKEVEHGNLEVQFGGSRRDEIGYLGASFNALMAKINDMLQRNTQLVKEVYEAKLLQKEAQINTLFNQIRPHFIFNTLNMISLTMQAGKQEKAIDHINKLSSMLRSLTTWDKEVPLQREIDLLHAYLGIQSSRYEGRLTYALDIDPALAARRIPALLLQPIVENAVIHGCERKKEPTAIRVYSRLMADRLLICVADDGLGMDARALAALQGKLASADEAAAGTALPVAADVSAGGGDGFDRERKDGKQEPHTGIGLVNVNRRIKARYGAAYGLSVVSAEGAGTTVEVALPPEE
ncbi:sensor histidine kinase [Paenibacillus cymbidii]|uniref:sensor histidine kinase n=1 Tax=Paenibacillus cymbidii TaxID=1639034 RepID=UPI001081C38B|nr:sensor histidine kinase [Paenibacillus cymbidii]